MTGQAVCGLGSETVEEHNKRVEEAREFWRKYYEEREMSYGCCKRCGTPLKIINVNHKGVLYCPKCPKEAKR